MRTHRPHKKSRNGCTTCKRRKIKARQCDERKPVCSPCAYRATTTTCTYNDFVHFVRSPQLEPTSVGGVTEYRDNRDDQVAVSTPPSRVALSELFSRLPRSPLPSHGTGIPDSTLLAHYCQRSSMTLGGAAKSEVRERIWRQGVPYVAYQHQCVSHAIAALAAMHVWCERIRQPLQSVPGSQHLEPSLDIAPRKDQELLTGRYLHQATIHHGQCLRWFQQELRSVGEHNVDVILACSALLAPFGLAYSQVERRRIQSRRIEGLASTEESQGLPEQDQKYQCLCQSRNLTVDLTWINLMRGIQPSIQATEFKRVRESAILPLLQWSEDERQITLQATTPGRAASPPNENSDISEHPLLSKILAEGDAALAVLQKQLEAIQMQRETLPQGQQFFSSSDLGVCLEGVKALQIVTRQFAVVKAGNHRFLMAWVSRLDNTFVKILAENDVIALAVYTHFLVYAILLEDLWWVGDLGVATIRNILEGLGIIPCGERCSNEGGQGQSAADDGVGAIGDSHDLRRLFAWPARILELQERISSSYRSPGLQRGHSVPMR